MDPTSQSYIRFSPAKDRLSLELLAHRAAMLADVAWQLLTSSFVFPMIDRIESRRLVITGTGASEGAARYLAALLHHQLSLNAGFAPASSFLEPRPHGKDDVLIVFSQTISANSKVALSQCKRFGASALFTGIHPEGRSAEARLVAELQRNGTAVYVLPPEDESGSRLRILGPAMATLAGALMAQSIARSRGLSGKAGQPPQRGASFAEEPLVTLPDRIASARGRAEDATRGLDAEWAFRRWAFVTCGDYGELCEGLRWKWMEGLGIPLPPLWDVFQLTSGPLQSLSDEPLTLVALEREKSADNDGIDAMLYDRLEHRLTPGKHALVRLRACLPGHYAYFDHDAQSNWMLLRALKARPMDLVSPASKDRVAPLVELG